MPGPGAGWGRFQKVRNCMKRPSGGMRQGPADGIVDIRRELPRVLSTSFASLGSEADGLVCVFEGKPGEAPVEGQQMPATSSGPPIRLLCRSAASPTLPAQRLACLLGRVSSSTEDYRHTGLTAADGSDLEGWPAALTRTSAAFLMVQTGWMDRGTCAGRGWHALPPSGSALGGHSAVPS